MSLYITAIHTYDNIPIEKEYGINNVGYYKIENIDVLVDRPEGRYDYWLAYIKSGVGYFHKNGCVYTVGADHIFIYRPGEHQKYEYYSQDKPEVYWIHFGGTKIEELFSQCGIGDQFLFSFPNSTLCVDTINSLIHEMTQKKKLYEVNCIAKLVSLLIGIGRNIDSSHTLHNNATIEKICRYISNNYHLETTNKEYAAMCNMSTSHFLKLFKQVTGTSPQHYKTLIRIKTSEGLLINSNYSIAKISQIVGYNDSLYFSRIFKKLLGVCPTEFQVLNKGGLQNQVEK